MGIAIAGSASVYATGFTGERLYQYKIGAGGALEALSPAFVATGKEPFAVVVSPDGKNVYVTVQGANTLSLYERNTSTGLLTAQTVATIETGKEPQGIAIAGNATVYSTAYGSTAQVVNQYQRKLSVEVVAPLVTSESEIHPAAQDNNVVGALRVSARTPGTGFTITSSVAADTGKVAWRMY